MLTSVVHYVIERRSNAVSVNLSVHAYRSAKELWILW
jgi:hypothetical protein